MTKQKLALKITHVSINSLKPYKNNPRFHSLEQNRQIAKSMEEYGFIIPILVNEYYQVIAGHGRLEAAKLLKLETVPTIQVEHLTPEQQKAFTIADNKIAENSTWDLKLLGFELQELCKIDVDSDVSLTGFETGEIDLLIMGLNDEDDCPEPPIEEPLRSMPSTSQLGDQWEMNGHKLFCGNALNIECYVKLMDNDKARMIIADPPYNVAISGNVSGNGIVKHDNFAMACGEMSEEEFIEFLQTSMQLMKDFSYDGSLHYLFMDWRHGYEILKAGRAVYTELKNLCVWNKSNGGMGSFYRSKHELVYIFKNSTAKHINNIELGRFGRNRTNVWNYPVAASFSPERQAELAMHPTVKPVSLIADAILDASLRNDIILDPFSGSGSTLLAAEKTQRYARCMELDPYYVDLTIRRFQDASGIQAIRAADGVTFDSLTQI